MMSRSPLDQAGVVPAVNSVPTTTIVRESITKAWQQPPTWMPSPTSISPGHRRPGNPDISWAEVVSYNNPKANGTTEFTISSLISGLKSGTWQTGGNVILVPSTEPTTTVAGGQPLSSTINVASTVGFPTACSSSVPISTCKVNVTYTGITGSSFTGVSGGSGTLQNNGNVNANPYDLNLNPPQGSYPPTTTISGSQTLPENTIRVSSTANFPAAGGRPYDEDRKPDSRNAYRHYTH